VLERCTRALADPGLPPLSWTPEAQTFIDPSLNHQQVGPKAEPAAWVQDHAESYFDLASRVYAVMVNPELDPPELAARMDHLRWQWSCMAP
jgi:hypothetical protein